MDVLIEEQQEWQVIRKQIEEKETILKDELLHFSKETKQFHQYLVDYKGEIDPHEMFINSRLLEQQQVAETVSGKQLIRLEKQKKNPYFTQVDFVYDGEQTAEKIYIGSFSFSTKEERLLIYDWRAPIASIFYDYDLGKAHFQTPAGTASGDIQRKRQIKFKDGAIDYVVESDTTVFDEVLQNELRQQKGGQMSTIISTIQKEQNKVIRDNRSKDMIIQGVAGSGKTSIALHRIAFLLYHFRNRITSDQVMILSPNRTFSRFIAQVLPELGEEPVTEWTIDQFGQTLSDIADVPSRFQEIELLYLEKDPQLNERVRYLSSKKCVADLKGYLRKIEAFSPQSILIGDYEYNAEFILRRYKAYEKKSIFQRFQLIAEDIFENLRTRPFQPKRKPTKKQLVNRLKKMFNKTNSHQLYRDFLTEQGFEMKKAVSYSDLFPIIYIRLFLEGMDEFSKIHYLIIDEMQDYTPIQFEVFKKMFTCPVLLIGDFTQSLTTINELHLPDVQNYYPNAQSIFLTKSYRSTYEIITCAKKIIDDHMIEPVLRHGMKPKKWVVSSQEEEISSILELVEQLRKQDLATIALITKTLVRAYEWRGLLENQGLACEVLTDESTSLQERLSICPLVQSKGLEFDAVIVVDADEATYPGLLGRQQLFVAATRAMHALYFLQRE
ncbi:3'-5' exonuclease [Enterococcus avium]|uniref:HelD family protein n=1 Tax=Enterococcus avium TaxID=33945 RepID=UPI0022DFE253|nr:UvrD-helicase domain-containing protein [Enterococcus avium]MDT2407854.1 3'-5' exonuclease [Enterococcus avium]MDT2412208.1 3'-5' exonuclease [Enterococcus avium]MDT2442734.1 3'-5' exonuclease [Enterococcus avium]MDT2472981.1 3'-5' exonuclease [Enterococcus avium]MDT2486114.1 3'-5' exonuclease [Enterococcus avium]